MKDLKPNGATFAAEKSRERERSEIEQNQGSMQNSRTMQSPKSPISSISLQHVHLPGDLDKSHCGEACVS